MRPLLRFLCYLPIIVTANIYSSPYDYATAAINFDPSGSMSLVSSSAEQPAASAASYASAPVSALPTSFTFNPSSMTFSSYAQPAAQPQSQTQAQSQVIQFSSQPSSASANSAQAASASSSEYSFYPNQLAANAAATAYATSAANFAQQFVQQQQQSAAQRQQSPLTAQIDQQNLAKYSQYLDILQKAYGIQLPGELGKQAAQQVIQAHQAQQNNFQQSSYPTATVTNYQPQPSVQPQQQIYGTSANAGQYSSYNTQYGSQPTVVQQQRPAPQYSVYSSAQQMTSQLQPSSAQPQPTASLSSYLPGQQVPSSVGQAQQSYGTQTYQPQPTYPVYPPPQQAQTQQQIQSRPQIYNPQPNSYPQVQQPAQPAYPQPPAPQTSFQPAPALQPNPVYPPPQPAQPAPSSSANSNSNYHTAAISQIVRGGQTRPQVYTYSANGGYVAAQSSNEHQLNQQGQAHIQQPQAIPPTIQQPAPAYPSHHGQPTYPVSGVAQQQLNGNAITDESGAVYVAQPDPYAVYSTPAPPPAATIPPTIYAPTTIPPRTARPRIRPSTQRPRTGNSSGEPRRPLIAKPGSGATSSEAGQSSATTIQSLTQQIRKLPAVFYIDSKSESSRQLETLLRDKYGLPLVSFYVDKIDRPAVVQKHLHQLTAHKGMPYLFICGTFIGSEQHIDNYHRNGQIPQLVEYVCGEEKKKKKTKNQ